MKGITIRQPWAHAVADGHKPIENRSAGFPLGHRGELAIHAGVSMSKRGLNDERILAIWPHAWAFTFPTGVILALAELVDVHRAHGCCKPWGEDEYPVANPEQRTVGDVTHLVLANVRRLATPIRHRGALGLWHVPEHLAELIRSELP